MKSFYALELLTFNPSIALNASDDTYAHVIRSDSLRVRNRNDVFELSCPAEQIDQLAAMARVLSLQRVRVLRVNEAGGSSVVMMPDSHRCLESSGQYIFAIAMDDGQQADRPDAVSRRFAWLASCVFYQAAWERLVFFKTALHESQLEYVQLPPLQRASSQTERGWGFGPSATVAELEAFTDAVSAACSGQGWVYARAMLDLVQSQVQRQPGHVRSFAQLVDAMRAQEELDLAGHLRNAGL